MTAELEYGEAASRCRWKQIAARTSAHWSNMIYKATREERVKKPHISHLSFLKTYVCLLSFILPDAELARKPFIMVPEH